jgi:hypothetical protein
MALYLGETSPTDTSEYWPMFEEDILCCACFYIHQSLILSENCTVPLPRMDSNEQISPLMIYICAYRSMRNEVHHDEQT